MLATTGWDTTARLWDVATGTPGATLTGHHTRLGGCAFSADGTDGRQIGFPTD